jgi:hypothetical protein
LQAENDGLVDARITAPDDAVSVAAAAAAHVAAAAADAVVSSASTFDEVIESENRESQVRFLNRIRQQFCVDGQVRMLPVGGVGGGRIKGFTGTTLCNWLVCNGVVHSRKDAVRLGRLMFSLSIACAFDRGREFVDDDMLCQFTADKQSNEGSASTRVAANSTIFSSSSSSSRPSRPPPLPPLKSLNDADERVERAMEQAAAAARMVNELQVEIADSCSSNSRLVRAEENVLKLENAAAALSAGLHRKEQVLLTLQTHARVLAAFMSQNTAEKCKELQQSVTQFAAEMDVSEQAFPQIRRSMKDLRFFGFEASVNDLLKDYWDCCAELLGAKRSSALGSGGVAVR